MKKRSVFLILLLLCNFVLFAQVGISTDGSAPDPSAGLDMKFTTKGFLMPRVALTGTSSASPVTMPANGLMVYNTATTGNVTPGHYYWNGTAWIRMGLFAGGSGTAGYLAKWLTPNTLGTSLVYDNGTGVGIGTTNILGSLNFNNDNSGISWGNNTNYYSRIYDSIHLHFETDDQMFFDDNTLGTRMYINTTTGRVGIGTTTPAARLQVSGGAIMLQVDGPGLTFPANIGGGSGDWAYIQYYPESGENTKFQIVNNNDADDDISFVQNGAERMTIVNGSVGIGTSSPAASAVLDIAGTTKGVLIPRMTATARKLINAPDTGLLVFQTDTPSGFYYFSGAWFYIGNGQGGGGSVIDIDGNAYAKVKIGTQEWMAENLKVTHYCNGNPIPNVTDNAAWSVLTTGARCFYSNDSTLNEPLYGSLYNWYAVNDSRGICPNGWHAATNSDWTTLTTYLGGLTVAGGLMKTTSLWNSPNTGATNTTGFSGFPGGSRAVNGTSAGIGANGYWWTSTVSGSNAYGRQMLYNGSQVVQSSYNKAQGFSVRCVRN